MGNATGRENGNGSAVAVGGGGGGEDVSGRENGRENQMLSPRVPSADLMIQSPPRSQQQYRRPPYISAPETPVRPLLGNGPTFLRQNQRNETPGTVNQPAEVCVPTLISWSYGGNDVAVEGSWDSWRSRRPLHSSGTDHTILLVLPSGIYHYRFIVDGAIRHIPDLPYETDEIGNAVNLLDVHEYVPENFDTSKEFEAPPSPESSYDQSFVSDDDFAKDPLLVPPQLHLSTPLGTQHSDKTAPSSSSSARPQHIVLNHLFMEKGWSSQSVVALGMSHRFQSKYVSVVLYKPLKRKQSRTRSLFLPFLRMEAFSSLESFGVLRLLLCLLLHGHKMLY